MVLKCAAIYRAWIYTTELPTNSSPCVFDAPIRLNFSRGLRKEIKFYISLQNKLTFYLSEPPMNYYLYALSRLHLFDPPINIQNWVRVRSQACAYLINERPAALPTESQLDTIGKHRTPCAQSKSHKKISACVQLVQFTWQQGK
jgi:hypothetical protein